MSQINGGALNTAAINAAHDAPASPVFAPWGLVVVVGGTDITASLIDTAPVVIEAERNAARIADFSVWLQGTIDPNAWTGRSVTIDIVHGTTPVRVFSGTLTDPELDVATATLRCRCADELQRSADAMSQASLLALTGGHWSDDVFDAEATGYQRLQDLLSTVPKAAWLTPQGQLVCRSDNNTLAADYRISDAHILDASLSVELARRASLVNRIDVTLNARFERLYHRVQRLQWAWPLNFCESHQYQTPHMTRQMALDAIDRAGWQVVSQAWTPLWPTGNYTCGLQPVIFNNLSPDQLINGFDLEAARRWAQSVTDAFVITVQAPASIAVYGELAQSRSAAADVGLPTPGWGDASSDHLTLPPGFVWDNGGNRYRDDLDAPRLTQALNTVIAQAVQTITRSHAAGRVVFSLPIQPAIDLQHTLSVQYARLDAKGVVQRIRHSLELSTARAVTDIELAIHAGQSGQDVTTPTWTPPSHPAQPTGPANPPITVPNHIGRSWFTVPFDASLWGWFANRQSAELIAGVPPPNVIAYDTEQLIVDYPAIDDGKTQHRTDAVAYSLAIAVPHNRLVMTG